MKIRTDHLVAIVASIGWLAIAWVVVDYNLGLGSTTLRWPNPAHSTAAWTWDAREMTPTVLEAKSGQWLKVTLPRGFTAGTLNVKTVSSETVVVKAEPRVQQQGIATRSAGQNHQLSFHFSDLIARGKTFRFRLENPTTAPITIATISMVASR